MMSSFAMLPLAVLAAAGVFGVAFRRGRGDSIWPGLGAALVALAWTARGWVLERSGRGGTLEGDHFSGFLMLWILAALVLAMAATAIRSNASAPPARAHLLLAAPCLLVMVSTRNLFVFVVGLVLWQLVVSFHLALAERSDVRKHLAAVVFDMTGLIGVAILWWSVGSNDLAHIGQYLVDASETTPVLLGVGFVLVGVLGVWVVASVRVWNDDRSSYTDASFLSVSGLVAVAALLARAAGWLAGFPGLSLVVISLWAVGALVYGSGLSVWRHDVRGLCLGVLLVQAGVVLWPLTGGATATPSLLAHLGVQAGLFSLTALALDILDRDKTMSVFGLGIASRGRRAASALAFIGFTSLASFPITPGFITKLMLFESSALSGCVGSLALLSLVPAAYGCLRACLEIAGGPAILTTETPSQVSDLGATLALLLGLAALLWLGWLPETFISMAREAAAEIF